MIERITTWQDGDRGITQVAVAWLSEAWEPLGEVTAAVGPFDDLEVWVVHCRDVLEELGVQLAFELGV